MQDSKILATNSMRKENVGDNCNHRSHKRYEASAERTDGPHARLVNFGLSHVSASSPQTQDAAIKRDPCE